MNTTAMNVEDPDLKEFYNYIQTHEATGTFTREIEQKVQELRKDKYIRSQYMQLEELMQAREEQGGCERYPAGKCCREGKDMYCPAEEKHGYFFHTGCDRYG